VTVSGLIEVFSDPNHTHFSIIDAALNLRGARIKDILFANLKKPKASADFFCNFKLVPFNEKPKNNFFPKITHIMIISNKPQTNVSPSRFPPPIFLNLTVHSCNLPPLPHSNPTTFKFPTGEGRLLLYLLRE
jgi:hypothetical protein